MLIYFNDVKTNKPVAVNPEYVVVVFIADEEGTEYTVINTLTGNIVVDDTQLNVVALLNGAK
jgi:hypothetical protein